MTPVGTKNFSIVSLIQRVCLERGSTVLCVLQRCSYVVAETRVWSLCCTVDTDFYCSVMKLSNKPVVLES